MEGTQIPDPPWRKPLRAPTRREPLTRDAIVAAAVVILDREGLGALSMRKVADELNTGAASLYWHVRDKEEVLDLVLDAIAGNVALPEPDPARWQEQLKEMARDSRRVLKEHRDAARLSMGRFPIGPNLLRVTEWLLAVLRAGGLPDRVAAFSAQLFFLYVGAFTFDETGSLPTTEDGEPDQMLEGMRSYFASLPAEVFPNLVALTQFVTDPNPDERFELGLDLLVGGLASRAAAKDDTS